MLAHGIDWPTRTVFADFLRVGSLRRIDKRLLPHSLHARQNSGKSDAASELADMLKTCTDPQEAALLRRELEQVSPLFLSVKADKQGEER